MKVKTEAEYGERPLLFRRFSAPKAKIELKLDEVAYEHTDKLTGKIVIDAEEEILADEFRLEFTGSEKTKMKESGSSRSSSLKASPSYIGVSVRGGTTYQRQSSSSSLEAKIIHVGGPAAIQKGQHHEVPFKIDIPPYFKPDPFMEIEIKVKGVVAVKGRPDLTYEIKPIINFPYVVECLRRYGGCGSKTPPSTEPARICPTCGSDLEEIWSRKHREEAEQAHQVRGLEYSGKRG